MVFVFAFAMLAISFLVLLHWCTRTDSAMTEVQFRLKCFEDDVSELRYHCGVDKTCACNPKQHLQYREDIGWYYDSNSPCEGEVPQAKCGLECRMCRNVTKARMEDKGGTAEDRMRHSDFVADCNAADANPDIIPFTRAETDGHANG